jgi:hypothetical protein
MEGVVCRSSILSGWRVLFGVRPFWVRVVFVLSETPGRARDIVETRSRLAVLFVARVVGKFL